MASKGNPKKHYSKEDKQKAIAEYYAGRSPNDIIEEYGIPQRTFFNWINKAKDNIGSRKKVKGSKDAPSHARDEEDCQLVTAKLPIGTATYSNDVDYIAQYATKLDYDKMMLQTAAINGYCQGIRITDDMLDEALKCEGIDKVYAVLACVKERRQLQDRIIKVFSEVSATSDEYERMFGRLFNITPKRDEE